MILSKRYPIILFFALFILALAAFSPLTQAQFQASSSVSVTATPQTPGPFETVSLTLSSFSADLNRAQISWSLNGAVMESGVGKTRFSFTTGGIGNTSVVIVSVRAGVLGTITERLVFTPSDVDLLWEATESYTPPFYKGKALPASKAIIRIVAIPHLVSGGKELSAEGLVYTWKKNNKAREFRTQSGYGRGSVVFRRDFLRPSEVIGLSVSSFGGSLTATKQIFFTDSKPKAILYVENPLEGIQYEKAVNKEFTLDKREIRFVVEPYFFSVKDRNASSLVFDWRLNNKTIAPEENGSSSIVFRSTENQVGKSQISLDITHVSNFLQKADISLSVLFGEQNFINRFFQ